MPSQPKVKQYQDHEVDLSILLDRAFEVFRKQPFRWQLEAAQAILCSQDIVLDIGTGSGKTLCFTMPLLLNYSDIALTVSPSQCLWLTRHVNFTFKYSSTYQLIGKSIQTTNRSCVSRDPIQTWCRKCLSGMYYSSVCWMWQVVICKCGHEFPFWITQSDLEIVVYSFMMKSYQSL